LLVLREGAKLGLAKAFEDEQAEIVRFSGDPAVSDAAARQPKMRVILHSHGNSTVEPHTMDSNPCLDHSLVSKKMQELGYLSDAEDPLIPPLAKFYHVNSLGPMTIWPPHCLGEAQRLLKANSDRDWKSNPWDLVFVFPRVLSNKTKTELKKYGTASCSSHVRGGGPFLLKDSAELVSIVLRRLGFIDDALNANIHEAIDVFCGQTMNKRSLQGLGLSHLHRYSLPTKNALLHGALTSPRAHGHWQVAPVDTMVRQHLVSRSAISSMEAPL